MNISDDLAVIEKPELQGAASNYLGIVLPATTYSDNRNLPNYIQSYFKYPLLITGACLSQTIQVAVQNPVGISSYVWNFGDPASGASNTSTLPNPTHTYSSPGNYMVKGVLYNSNGCGADTVRKVVYAGQPSVNLGNDTAICQGDSLTLRMRVPYGHNVWSNGSTDTVLKVTVAGQYWVQVNVGGCSIIDTINITQNSLPQFSLGNDTVVCNNNSYNLSPTPSIINAQFLWQNASTAPTNLITNAGLYWLQITNAIGCKKSDSINISFKTLPNFNLGADASFCQGDSLVLSANVLGATSYLWSTGASSQNIKVFSTNTYWCAVNKEGCIYADSINIIAKPLPIVKLGNDTSLCEGITLLLNATNINANYQWQNGNTTPTFLVSNAGQYHVQVNLNNCIVKDTINIQYIPKPKFSLGADKFICPQVALVLTPNITSPTNTASLQYIWQNGSILPTFNVLQQGTYTLAITNNCGATTDTVLVKPGLCKVWVPNAFSPNADGLNDVFKLQGSEQITNFTMQIYNRWGGLIFETKNPLQGWAGLAKNKPQPVGTYVYKISFTNLVNNEVEVLNGTVTLIR